MPQFYSNTLSCIAVAFIVFINVVYTCLSAPIPTPATHSAVLDIIPIAPYAISADGRVVVGALEGLAYKWDSSHGAVALGQLQDERPDGWATGVSSDGSVIVGRVTKDPDQSGIRGERAFRWTLETGMVDLGFLSENAFGRTYSVATNVSSDGSTVVGYSSSANFTREAFVWSKNSGFKGLGVGSERPHSSNGTIAYGVSGDGKVVVGENDDHRFRAFKWSVESGYEFFRDTTGTLNSGLSEGLAISDDASTIVGRAHTIPGLGIHAFVWSAELGILDLGDLPGWLNRSSPRDLSADGSIVVGESHSGSEFGVDTEAFIWDHEGGIRNLRSWLQWDFGLDLDGWHLETATGISADGLTIVGQGRQTPGVRNGNWRVRFVAVPEPSAMWLLSLGLLGLAARRGRVPLLVYRP